MLTTLLSAAALFYFSSLPSVTADATDCGGAAALFTITKLSFPSTVTSGENATLVLEYTVPEEVAGGTATTSLSYNYIPFEPTTEDLCAKTTCPITVGDHDGSVTSLVPSATGYIDSKVEWRDGAGRLLLCIDATFMVNALRLPSWKSLFRGRA